MIDAVYDGSKVLAAMQEVHVVDIDDEHTTLVVVEDEVLVALVEPLEVVELNGLLVVASAALYVGF